MDIDFGILWNDTDNSAAEHTDTPSEPSQSLRPINNYTPNEQIAVQSSPALLERELLLEQAVRIVKDYKQKRAAAEGIMKQIEQDIVKQDPMMLLFAAEALDRMSGRGDRYIKRLEEKAAAAGIKVKPYIFCRGGFCFLIIHNIIISNLNIHNFIIHNIYLHNFIIHSFARPK